MRGAATRRGASETGALLATTTSTEVRKRQEAATSILEVERRTFVLPWSRGKPPLVSSGPRLVAPPEGRARAPNPESVGLGITGSVGPGRAVRLRAPQQSEASKGPIPSSPLSCLLGVAVASLLLL